ncbi:MAG: nicotinate (nicotinamide) nucleotide adenylyltransferase [Ruminococcaceae bacterium]|nr:nicotinate (nicotinamide) nucleotide adenylyltransferase [Oscillospiraceae bacterium]
MNKTERIGLFGGTFAPPHLGHVHAVRTMSEHLELDKILIMPASIPPHKIMLNVDAAETRYEMCRAAFCGIDKVEVSDFEIKKGGISYTYETLEYLCGENREIYFLCGTDMFLTIDKWKNSERIFELAKIVCVPRYFGGFEKITEKAEEYKNNFSADVIVIGEDPFEVSSTEIRDLVERGDDLSKYIPREVIKIINDEKLYRK